MDTPQTKSSQTHAPQAITALRLKTSAVAVEVAPPVPLTPAQVSAALVQAKETHGLVIEWVRSFDAKIGPLLTADGALVAGCLAVLGQQTSVLTPRPVTQVLLAVTLLPLLYSLLMAISAISPALKWGRWGTNRHLPERPKTKPTSILFFGQIARYDSADTYAEAAKCAFLDESVLLDDLLKQTYLNAKIAQNKSAHIALSARGLFIALVLLLLCALTFTLKL